MEDGGDSGWNEQADDVPSQKEEKKEGR